MKSSDSVKFPFQKRALSAAGPWLELAQAVLFLSFGILTLANGSLAFRFLQGTASAGLAIAGITRLVQMLSAEKKAAAFLSAAGFAALAVLMAVSPSFFAFPAALLFGLWFIISGLARGTIAIQCWTEDLEGKFRNSFAALLSLAFGVSLILNPSLRLHTVFIVAGIYLILYSAVLLLDFVSGLFLSNQVGDRIKRKVRIALPTFITAFIPSRLIDDFNRYFATHQNEGGVIRQTRENAGKKPDLEVFIHLSDVAFGRMGHVDIRLDDTVYSYGCYDHYSNRLFGLVSDGTVAMAPIGPYIRHCLTFENKILVGFGLNITQKERTVVEKQLENLKAVLVPWKSDLEKKREGLPIEGDCTDAASELVKATGASIYKVQSGPFRKYFAINTNCVKLADTIIGPAGLDILRVNAIATPAAIFPCSTKCSSGAIPLSRNAPFIPIKNGEKHWRKNWKSRPKNSRTTGKRRKNPEKSPRFRLVGVVIGSRS